VDAFDLDVEDRIRVDGDVEVALDYFGERDFVAAAGCGKAGLESFVAGEGRSFVSVSGSSSTSGPMASISRSVSVGLASCSQRRKAMPLVTLTIWPGGARSGP